MEELVGEMTHIQITPAQDDVELPSVDAANRRVTRLNRDIEKCGPVNMLAIEQYEEVNGRLLDFKRDLQSLEDERTSLLGITEQLQEQRVRRLTLVFDQINSNFMKIFKRLSQGGSGQLRLENMDDPFQGGLLMEARPAGKRKGTRLSSLSGGEKSMVALAFIFAVQRYDPSPFYYLDEVDQNLDSDNAQLIAELCREVSHEAQFIMVTLRKVSLQLADHHIGVTHAGDGISRLLMDIDQDRAIELGQAALEESDSSSQKQELSSKLPQQKDMPLVSEEEFSLTSSSSSSLEAIRLRSQQNEHPIGEKLDGNKPRNEPSVLAFSSNDESGVDE